MKSKGANISAEAVVINYHLDGPGEPLFLNKMMQEQLIEIIEAMLQ